MATNQMRREAAKRKLANQQKRRTEQLRKRKRNATIAAVVTVVVLLVAAVGVYVYVTRPTGPDNSGQPAAALPKRPTALPASVSCTYTPDEPAAKPVTPPGNGPAPTQGTVAASLQTTAGPIDMTLDRALAPCTVKSFVSLVQKGYYIGTACHRLTTGSTLQVLQCGDPAGDGSGGPGYTIPDEVFPGLTYGRGLLAMAKTSRPNSGGSQFFIIYGESQLPPQYTVFGSVGPQGLETVDDVAHHDEPSGTGDGTPNERVEVQSATVS